MAVTHNMTHSMTRSMTHRRALQAPVGVVGHRGEQHRLEAHDGGVQQIPARAGKAQHAPLKPHAPFRSTVQSALRVACIRLAGSEIT